LSESESSTSAIIASNALFSSAMFKMADTQQLKQGSPVRNTPSPVGL
jgi:hypothetical protein